MKKFLIFAFFLILLLVTFSQDFLYSVPDMFYGTKVPFDSVPVDPANGKLVSITTRSQTNLLFSDGFSNTDLSENWIIFGSPLPVIDTNNGQPAPSFDNNGDSNYNSGAISKSTFDYTNGLSVSADMFVSSNPNGCWMEGLIGIAKSFNVGSTVWPGYVVRFEYRYSGSLCWADEGEKEEGYLIMNILTENGDNEGYTVSKFNDCLDSWHNFRFTIDKERYVSFYVDDQLIYRTENRLHPDYTNMPLLLGSRSSQYGKVYHDNIKVYAGEGSGSEPVPLKTRLSCIINNEEQMLAEQSLNITARTSQLEISDISLDMPYDDFAMDNAATSRSFRANVLLKPDTASNEKIVKIFELPGYNHTSLSLKVDVFNEDTDELLLTKSKTFEVWAADFQYGQDNYRFHNWGSSFNEIGEITNIIYKTHPFLCATVPLYSLIMNIEDIMSTAGHCYGMASSSIIYKENPSAIPYNKNKTFDLLKDEKEAIENIKYAQAQQFFISMILQKNQWHTRSQLQKIMNALNEDKLLIASFEHHATLLHTMINYERYGRSIYDLYTNDSRYVATNMINQHRRPTPNGRFVESDGEVSFLPDKVFYFNHPDFNLPNTSNKKSSPEEDLELNSIYDSLINAEIKMLIDSNLNVMVYRDNSYADSMENSRTDVLFSGNIRDSINLGSFRVYYIDKNSQGSVILKSEENKNMSLEIIKPSWIDNRFSLSKSSFENITIQYDATMKIDDYFSEDPVLAVDEDDNGSYDTKYQSGHISYQADKENIAPSLTTYIPLLTFSRDTLSFIFELRNYLYDDHYENLHFELNYNDSLVRAEVTNTTLTIELLKNFSGNQICTLKVNDENNTLIIPITLKSKLNSGTLTDHAGRYLTIYPNPASSYINFLPGLLHGGQYLVIIRDEFGRILMKKENSRGQQNPVYIGNLPAGVYFMEILSDTKYVGKFMVK